MLRMSGDPGGRSRGRWGKIGRKEGSKVSILSGVELTEKVEKKIGRKL
jgi:hypothetical protein